MRVLIIEDEERLARNVAKVLRGLPDFAVDVSLDGEDGQHMALSSQYDLIILDLMLPGMDGFEVLARVKADERTRPIPIIVVTAKDLTPEEHALLNGQMAALLRKGLFRTEDLLADVARVLREEVGPGSSGSPAL